MAYIIITAAGEEMDRVELHGQITIGRCSDCDLPVRDVLMSRHHSRIEKHLGGWRAVDLHSKNGLRLGWDRVRSAKLREGDVLRLGRTQITFMAGEFVAGDQPSRRSKMVRPADPFEALAGTVSGFVLDDSEHSGCEMPHSPMLAGHLSPSHLSPSPGDDEPSWARDLPEEGDVATMTARPRRSTDHWSAPTPQPRLQGHKPASKPRMTDLSLQAHPQTDFHLPRKKGDGDRRLFLMILAGVTMVTTGAVSAGMWWVSGG